MGRTEKHLPIDLVRDYLRSNPNVSNGAAARHLMKMHPGTWKTGNAAEVCVRRARGSQGKQSRDKAAEVAPKSKFGDGDWWIPPSSARSKPQINYPGAAKYLLLSDIHFPYQDNQALKAALKCGEREGCDSIYLNGDTLDFYALSDFDRDPTARSAWDEIKTVRKWLASISDRFRGRKIFKVGNHEARWERYLWAHSPDLAEIDDFALCSVLRLRENGWDFIESKSVAYLGKLAVWHGHELPRGLAPAVNPARGVYMQLKETALVGHFHRSSTHVEASGFQKESVSCWSTGCLAGMWPNYAVINKWNSGWAIVDVDKTGGFTVTNYQMHKGHVYQL